MKKVNKLLQIALEEGGIEHEIDAAESSSDSSEAPAKKASELLSNEDYFDKEEDSGPKESEAKRKRVVEESTSGSSGGSGSSEEEPAEKPLTKKVRFLAMLIYSQFLLKIFFCQFKKYTKEGKYEFLK